MSNPSESEFFFYERTSPVRSSSSGATDRGRVRRGNQDQYLIAQLNKSMSVTSSSMPIAARLHGTVQGEVLLVADGMGGHAAGEQASRIAIEQLVRRMLGRIHWHFQGEDDREPDFVEQLQSLLRDAHTRILVESSRNANQRGMGTTLTMAYIVWPRMYVVHAGDSRCYLVREGIAKSLTTDHTLARQMVEAGGLKPEDESGSKWSNVLWNVLGGRPERGELTAEVRRVDLQWGDRVVLCSDGLHRYLDEKAIAEIISRNDSPDDSCRELIQAANDAGGEDNITVIVSQHDEEEAMQTTWIDDMNSSTSDDEDGSFELQSPSDLQDGDLQDGDLQDGDSDPHETWDPSEQS